MSILALTTNTLAVTAGAGQIEYNGQFFATDSNASRGQLQRLSVSTAQASTSGTSIDFTGIPAWVKRITVMLNSVSTNGTSPVQIQLGAGSIDTIGYTGGAAIIVGAGASSINFISGFASGWVSATNSRNGAYVINLLSGSLWNCTFTLSTSEISGCAMGGGNKNLAGTLDRIRITTVNGTDTFDTGLINIMYEG